MSVITLPRPPAPTGPLTAPSLDPASPVRLIPAAPALWRVTDRRGRVIGHLQAFADEQGTRYRALLFRAASRAFLELGEFWRVDDAVDCLRFAS